MTVNDLSNIFYSNFTPSADWEQLGEILWLYEERIISLDKKLLASVGKLNIRIDQVENPKYGLIKTGESIKHMALKSFARDFLIEKLEVPVAEVLFEQVLGGFEVDVIDKDRNYPVECGDTNASKLEFYLGLQTTKRFFVIPYPHYPADVYLYEFKAEKKLFDEYAAFKSNYLKEKRSKYR